MTNTAHLNFPRDVLLHLLAIITLIVSAVSLGVLSFQYVNLYIPDVVSDHYFSKSSYLSSMRYSLATLVVVFPAFIWVYWFLRKDINKFPEKRDLKIRKWLLYLTLFVAALVIMGDLIALLRSFLEGELSQRFVSKVLIILFIAGSIFVHYLSELKDRVEGYAWIRVFDWVVATITVASVIAGFFMAGTPGEQRLVRLDERRVSDLQSIQWQIINYWQRKEFLPAMLENLADPIGGFMLPRDPSSGAEYGYNSIDNLSFEICASFSTDNSGESYQIKGVTSKPIIPVDRLGFDDVWQHGVGSICFKRTIDPDLYPPLDRELKIIR